MRMLRLTKLWLSRLPYALLVIPACAAADTAPVTSVERYLEVATAAERARSRLFELSRLLLPVCQTSPTWTLGVPPFPLSREPSKLERARQVRERVMRDVGGQPGEQVFTTEQYKTPYAVAGVRRGDRLVPNGDEAAPGTRPGALTKQGREEESRALEARPERSFTLRRGSSELPIVVNAIATCGLQLYAIDSQYAYADIYIGAIAVTLPLLASLSDAELTMVLAHEAAQRVLGADGGVSARRSALDMVLPTVAVGVRNLLAKNTETDTLAPSSADLIEADRLAVALLQFYGIGADAYLRFLQRMQEMPRVGAVPVYRVARPLSTQRQADLEEQIRLAAKGETLQPPKSVEPAKLAELQSVGQALLRADALTLAVAAAESAKPTKNAQVAAMTHRLRVPAATGYAQFDDLAAVPIRDEGKERFRHYLTLPSPKAFVVNANGGWRFAWNNANAMTLALDRCARDGNTCWLYAVDDQVVYDADPSKRVAQSGQLKDD